MNWLDIVILVALAIAVLIGLKFGLIKALLLLAGIIVGVNRLGGAVLGLFLGAFFCGGLLAMWVHFLGMPQAIADSAIATVLLDRLPMVLALLPGEFGSVRSYFY
jgi:membrane protein required for colicin V production